MHLEDPKEYISLVKGEEDNFSEVYGFRYEMCLWLISAFFMVLQENQKFQQSEWYLNILQVGQGIQKQVDILGSKLDVVPCLFKPKDLSINMYSQREGLRRILWVSSGRTEKGRI